MSANTTVAKRIRCGHCRDYHASVAAVRECSQTEHALAVQAPAAPVRHSGPVTEAGMYRLDGVIYKVQKAVHGSGKLYAKEMTQVNGGAWKFEYAPGAIRDLHPEHRMTLDEAKEFGALYGTCCVCGRTLTNEDSIAAGIGPVCSGKV